MWDKKAFRVVWGIMHNAGIAEDGASEISDLVQMLEKYEVIQAVIA